MRVQVDAFVEKFNAVDQDMRFDDRTKAELGLLVEELRNALWVKIEEKKRVGLERLKSTEEDEWVEKREHCIKHDFGFLMQVEVDRFWSGVELLIDQNSASMGNAAAEGALEAVEVEEEEDTKGKGKKGGKDKKGKDKKKGGKGAADEEEGEAAEKAKRSKVSTKVFTVLEFAGRKVEEVEVEDPKAKAKKGGKKGAEVEEEVVKDVLIGTLEASMKFTASWSKDVYVVGEGGGEGEGEETWKGREADREKMQRLHESIWHEAEVLKARVQRLYDAGHAAVEKVKGLAGKCYRKVEADIEDRILREIEAVEKCVAAGREKIAREEPVVYAWGLQSLEFWVDVEKRLVPVEEPEPAPDVREFWDVSWNDGQMVGLGELMGEDGGGEWWVEDVVNMIMRLRGDEVPAKWAGMDYNELWDVIMGVKGEEGVEDKVDGRKVLDYFGRVQ